MTTTATARRRPLAVRDAVLDGLRTLTPDNRPEILERIRRVAVRNGDAATAVDVHVLGRDPVAPIAATRDGLRLLADLLVE